MMRLLLAFALLALFGTPARADDNQPLTVTIVGEGQGAFRVTWKIPVNVAARHLPALLPGAACNTGAQRRDWADPLGTWAEERWQCPQGLIGKPVAIRYPAANPNLATIVRYRENAAADADTLLLQPQDTAITLPAPGDASDGFVDFLVLGIEHIWAGVDHLLFVAGLIFIAGTPRRVLTTITGFTLAHSVTLALAALDLVHLPIRAIEGVIALSIVFLAVEIAKGPRDTLTWRKPVVVASAFGLLHGFGFAAVLRDVGLPQDNLLPSLLAFNIGIELGQVMFAAAVMAMLALANRIPARATASVQVPRLAGYGVGILASFWMFQRVVG